MRLPSGLSWIGGSPAGTTWLDELPVTLEQCATRWGLTTIGEPYASSYTAFVVPASLRDGTDVVLKIAYPHHESDFEPLALERWDGAGAVRLLRQDQDGHAFLIERCTPGTHLSDEDPNLAVDVLTDLLPRLWKPAAAPFHTLSSEATRWARTIPADWETAGRPCPLPLVDAALEAIDELAPSQGEQVLLHQDLHGENVLAAAREPWLVIDPKPLTGEREFSLASIVRASEFGHSRSSVVGRLDTLSERLRLDRERARRWTLVQTLAWSFSSSGLKEHLDTVRWLHDAH